MPQLGSARLGTFVARLGSSRKIPARAHQLRVRYGYLGRKCKLRVVYPIEQSSNLQCAPLDNRKAPFSELCKLSTAAAAACKLCMKLKFTIMITKRAFWVCFLAAGIKQVAASLK